MEDPDRGQRISFDATSSSSSISTPRIQPEEDTGQQENEEREGQHHNQEEQQQRPGAGSVAAYRLSRLTTETASSAVPSEMREDVWSCLLVLLTFWLFASMTLILGVYGSQRLNLGPHCSRLMQTNSLFVQSITAQMTDEPKSGPMLYGFYEPPPLDVEVTWTEAFKVAVAYDLHKEWIYFLNKGSKLDIFYSVKTQSTLPVSLIIAQGKESLVEWIDDPSHPNTTLSWNIIEGSGVIQQKISKSSDYYIAVGNLNNEEVEVELTFMVNAFVYNTTQAYYRCPLNNNLCSLKLFLLGTNAAILTSPAPEEVGTDYDWQVKLSFGPRWITYFIGSGIMTVICLLTFRFCNVFQDHRESRQVGETAAEHTPLLSHKDEDNSSWGSSYDSNSHDEEDVDEWLAKNSHEGKQLAEGENPRRLCVICFDAPRDCFFLPCGHCAACFTCATRIAEEAATCPICRRGMKKVRKIFTV
ncbi:hypothetical protein K2173_012303 [Erythroxylum novogranatense]|uniref:RING-type domain-containing protein n=1 Tax=Erythroxylum novogranatense TaxID=1862640 RepID=A0AAV8SC03_9ROSI|nr:hypothetical protein K2173_012303 [Erythroxylum novogranatense]